MYNLGPTLYWLIAKDFPLFLIQTGQNFTLFNISNRGSRIQSHCHIATTKYLWHSITALNWWNLMQPNDGMVPSLTQPKLRVQSDFLQLYFFFREYNAPILEGSSQDLFQCLISMVIVFVPKTWGCFGLQLQMACINGVTALTTYNITGMMLQVAPITRGWTYSRTAIAISEIRCEMTNHTIMFALEASRLHEGVNLHDDCKAGNATPQEIPRNGIQGFFWLVWTNHQLFSRQLASTTNERTSSGFLF